MLLQYVVLLPFHHGNLVGEGKLRPALPPFTASRPPGAERRLLLPDRGFQIAQHADLAEQDRPGVVAVERADLAGLEMEDIEDGA